MHAIIVALLVLIVVVLLGLFWPLTYAAALAVSAVASELLFIGLAFVAAVLGLFAYHAARD